MLGAEKYKEKLFLEYLISVLYVKAGCSTSELSVATGVPLSTVKRSLSTIRKNIDSFLELLPELGDKNELLSFQEIVDLESQENKRTNKWGSMEGSLILSGYEEEVDIIRELYIRKSKAFNKDSRLKVIEEINNLTINKNSCRAISQATGVSLGFVSKVQKMISNETNNEKGQK